MAVCCCSLAGTKACENCYHKIVNSIGCVATTNQEAITYKQPFNPQRMVRVRIGCKECGHIEWINVALPINFANYQCGNCNDKSWLPMVIDICELELPKMKNAVQGGSDKDIKWEESMKGEWRNLCCEK
jgi:hypothetical protein